ncbi:glutathione binding-like protein [Psychrobacter sp. JCM 18901]|uniref:glutathione binding-like protein n=1 Tax=Psychrobacter sp. JCM 18901 TaxID=1298609 RepID=UPI0021C2D8AA|nr:glutathione binding-like protein [Psychrobacter sp. JCM 18901]
MLDTHLEGREYMVGDSYSIADISTWGWIDKATVVLSEGGLDNYPNLKRWFDSINARPAVQKARDIPKGIDFKTEFDDVAARALYPQNFDKNS